MMRSSTAAPAPSTMPHSRCRGFNPRQASAITSALSPDNRMLIQMILPSATQKVGSAISSRNWLKTDPMVAGSKICQSQITRRPFASVTASAGELADALVAREELRDLDRGGLRRVRAVHRVLAERICVELAPGALGRLGRVRRAHD